MTCFFCKGVLENGYTTHSSEIGSYIIVIKEVPCLKCEQCGEISYTGEIYEQLEKLIDLSQNSHAEVTIIKFSNKVA